VKQFFADDTAWVERVTAKLEKRTANQAKYSEFQKREEACQDLPDYLSLSAEIMQELEDPFYAGKLLNSAEKVLEGKSFNFGLYRTLILAVDTHLKDQKWVKRLFDYCAQQCQHFAALRQVGQSAVALLADKEFGKQLARSYYQSYEKQILSRASKSVYDYTKLCTAVYEDLRDDLWAKALLDKAESLGADHLGFAQMAKLAEMLGDHDWVERLYQKAVNCCTTAAQFIQLGNRLRGYGMSQEQLRSLYDKGVVVLKSPQEQLRWAEGIVELFNHRDWARQGYERIASLFTSDSDKAVYHASRQHRLEKKL
jgi:hypothetical protein